MIAQEGHIDPGTILSSCPHQVIVPGKVSYSLFLTLLHYLPFLVPVRSLALSTADRMRITGSPLVTTTETLMYVDHILLLAQN